MKGAAFAILIVGAAAATAADVRAHQDPRQPMFRVTTESVAVTASVHAGARPITTLKATDFALTDNGVAQEITDVSDEKLPIDMTILLDRSLSVAGPIVDGLRLALRDLVATLRPVDRLKVTLFNERVARFADFGPPSTAIVGAFSQMDLGGGTSIHDALALSLTVPSSVDRRHLIVLLTDGYDTRSILDDASVLDMASRADATVDAVIIQSHPKNVPDREFYDALTDQTVGFLEPILAGSNLSSTFRKAIDQFRQTYVLHFTPKGVAHEGLHELSVRVIHGGPYEVRARKNYSGG